MKVKFENLGLDSALIKALKTEAISIPTDIQAKAIPEIMQGRDVMMQSATATGKTLAYLLPIFEKIKDITREVKVIILAPTHELVIQIQRQIERISNNSLLPISSTPLIGGANISRQIDKLKKKPQIIVGSSGRILELIQKKKIKVATINTIILDEADRLLDRHNVSTVLEILKCMNKDRQIIVASATLQKDKIDTSGLLMSNNNVLIQSGSCDTIPEGIEHLFLVLQQREKIDYLRKMIRNIKPTKSLIFINSVDQIDILTKKLQFHGIKTASLHGTNQKKDRKRVMDNFKSGKLQVLIASDIAARGLQMDGLTYVFNMDIPENPKDYVHRAGRTGRNRVNGVVVSLATERELSFLRKIENKLNLQITQKYFFEGKFVDLKS